MFLWSVVFCRFAWICICSVSLLCMLYLYKYILCLLCEYCIVQHVIFRLSDAIVWYVFYVKFTMLKNKRHQRKATKNHEPYKMCGWRYWPYLEKCKKTVFQYFIKCYHNLCYHDYSGSYYYLLILGILFEYLDRNLSKLVLPNRISHSICLVP